MPDFRLAVRALARSPLLALVVVLSLALGIGANTAIFSFLHQVVLSSLPVQKPEELVVLNSSAEFKSGRSSTNNAGGMDAIFSYRMFRELEKHPQGVTGIAGFRTIGANLSFHGQTLDGAVMVVSGGYFPVLGVKPLVGRLIESDDDVHGNGRTVAVLSHGYWKNRLGGQEVLNQPLRVNGQVFTIVGVAPKGFTGTTLGDNPEIFVPLALTPRLTPGHDGTKEWNDYWVYSFARLRPGVTRQQAEAALNGPYAGLVEEQANATRNNWRVPADFERFRKSKLSLKDGRQGQSDARDDAKTPVLILMISTSLVLLIAIANTANLLLARAAQRRRELAIRTVLGAGRGRLVRQVLSESILLALAGGVVGTVLARWTIGFLIAALSDDEFSEWLNPQLQWPVLLFAIGISIVSGLLCGLYPAWQASRPAADVLKDQSGQSSASVASARVRKLLVAAQVTLSALLLVPTGLFLKSLVNLMRVDLGIRTENVITFRISPELNSYKPEQSRTLFARVEEELAAVPGVRSVTASMVPLISGSNWGNSLTVEGYSRDPKADTNSMFNTVGSGFFGKMGIPLVAGREFTDSDTLAGPKVAVVNERFAKHFFGNQNPIGRRFGPGLGNKTKLDIEIVGVARDSHYAGVKQKPPKLYYTPWRQDEGIGSISFYVRTALATDQMIPQIRRVMRGLDSDLPLEHLQTMQERIRMSIRGDHIILQLSAAFSLLATVLAMLGLYGVMAYSVTRRTREIGIRMALGAHAGRIRAMVMREVLAILIGGLAVGIAAALALTRYVESQLYGVKGWDPLVVTGAVAALTAAALFAGWLPARRAMRIEPTTALRYE